MARKPTRSEKKHSAIPKAANPPVKKVEVKQATIETAPIAVVEPNLIPDAPITTTPVAPTAAVTQELIADLTSDSTTARAEAAVELGNQRDASAADALIAAARDYDADVAREAVTALGKLGDRTIVP